MADDNVVSVKYQVDITEAKANAKAFEDALSKSLDNITKQLSTFTASTQSANAQLGQLASTAQNNFSAMQNAAQTSLNTITSQLAAIIGASNTTSSAIVQMANQTQQSSNQMVQALNQIVQSNNAIVQSLSSSGGAHKKHAESVGVNSTAIRELLTIIREGSRGDMTRMAGSLSILAQQFDFTRAIIMGLFSPIGLLAAAIAAVGYASYKGWQDQRDFNTQIELSGNKSGITEDKLKSMARSISNNLGVSTKESTALLSKLATSGEFTAKTTDLMAKAAIDFGRKSGLGVDEALSKFMQVDKGVVKLAYELNKNYAILTVAEAKRIKSLEDMGKKDEAEAILMQAVIDKTKSMNENLGTLEKAWRALSGAIGTATQALMDWGKAPSPQEKIRKLNRELEDFKSGKILASKSQIIAKEKELADAIQNSANVQKKADADAINRPKEQKQIEDILKPKKEKKASGAITEAQIVRGDLLEVIALKEKEALDEGRIFTERHAVTVKFYQDELAEMLKHHNIKARDIKAVRNQLLAEQVAELKEKQDILIASEQEIIKDTSKTNAERIAMAEKLKSQLRRINALPDDPSQGKFYQSKEYYSVDAEKTKIRIEGKKKEQKELEQIQNDIKKQNEQFSLEDLEETVSIEKIKLTEHKISKEQYLKDARDFITKKYEIKRAELAIDEVTATPKQKADRDLGLAKLERQESKEKQALDLTTAKFSVKTWDDAFKTIADSSASHFDKMLMKQESFKNAMKGITSDLLKFELKSVAESVSQQAGAKLKGLLFSEKMSAAELAVKQRQKQEEMLLDELAAEEGYVVKHASAEKGILSDAYEAGAAAYKATVGIPYVGPILAPAASVAAFAGTMAFGNSLPSAEGGWDIPSGVNPLTQLHEQEMVLPKDQANAIRALSKSNSDGGQSQEVHHHYNPTFNINTVDAKGVKQFFDEHAKIIARSMQNHARAMT
jgi:Prophage tail length tape measure protein